MSIILVMAKLHFQQCQMILKKSF